MPGRNKTLIPVRVETRRVLTALRLVLGARSYDEVIRVLIERYVPEDIKMRVKTLVETRA